MLQIHQTGSVNGLAETRIRLHLVGSYGAKTICGRLAVRRCRRRIKGKLAGGTARACAQGSAISCSAVAFGLRASAELDIERCVLK